jgi:hypothetical protein
MSTLVAVWAAQWLTRKHRGTGWAGFPLIDGLLGLAAIAGAYLLLSDGVSQVIAAIPNDKVWSNACPPTRPDAHKTVVGGVALPADLSQADHKFADTTWRPAAVAIESR